MSSPLPRTLTRLVLLLLAALAIRLLHIQTQSLWFDEGWSAYAATQPTLVAAAAADATNPPLYYVLLHISTRFLGDSVFVLRLFSALVGLLVVALAFRLARDLFGVRAGVYAALLTAFSPLLWWASQEARMYTLLALLVLAAAWAWQRLRQRPDRVAWLVLWAAELALLYAHNTGPVVALWLNAATLLAWLVRRRADRPPWRVWLAGQVLVGLLWLPYFVTRFLTLSEANSAVQSAPQWGLALLLDVWSAFWAGNWALVGHGPLFATFTDAAPFVGLAGVALVLFLLLVPWRVAAARWLAAHALLLTGGLLLGLGVLGNELHGRYLVMVTPLLLVPLGAGVARLRPLVVRLAGVLVFVGIFAAAVVYDQMPLYGPDDARGTVAYYAETLGPEDSVLAWSYADRYELAYYWDRLGVQAQRITLPEGKDLDTILPLLPTSGDIALNVWYTQRADYRGMLNCVLAHGTRLAPDTFTTYGMTSLVYRDEPRATLEITPYEADFGVARLDAIGELAVLSADRALCLPLEITTQQPLADDLQAAVVVRNALGWEVARADAIFATANQRTSSMVEPGTALAAYPLLRLPYGAPSGDYTLSLHIYDTGNLSGYEVSSGSGRGRELPLGVWSARPAQDWATTGRETELPYTRDDVALDGLTLLALNQPLEPTTDTASGVRLPLALLWQGAGPLPMLMLTDSADVWSMTVLPPERDAGTVALDWRELRIPANAPDSTAELRLPDGRVIARFRVVGEPFLADVPTFDEAVDVELPGVGRLVGFSLADNPVSLSQDVRLTLVWQAGEDAPLDTSYTVFAQLLDSGGQLIAQSDSIPAAGARPTTGWRPGEYVVDSHRLAFNDTAHTGSARLIVGLYDALSGERMRLDDGTDAIALPVTVDVIP
jgi:4-amino-4-deoxy-L-arabinose transferase-like glycosyltransferase